MSQEDSVSPPPAPPTSAQLRPPAAPPQVPLTPMMEFFQRRLEALEKELAVERERSLAAQNMLRQQEALRGEVESYLKSLTEQLKREKGERESEESKAHARGRVEALEKRLDEMNSTFASLLKDAVSQREGGAQAMTSSQEAIKTELTSVSSRLGAALEKLGEWQTQATGLERGFTTQVGERFEQLSREVRNSLGIWEKQQILETQKIEARLEAIGREREALAKAWEEQNHGIRQDFIKEKIERETRLGEQIAEVCRRLDAVKAVQEQAGGQSKEASERLAQVVELLLATPKAKDETIAALEMEKQELVRSLRGRADALEKYAVERRGVEESLGKSLLELHQELDKAKNESRTLAVRIADLELANAILQDKLVLAEKKASERDERREALAAERDQLARALIVEAGNTRGHIEARSQADEEWTRKFAELQQKLEAEVQRRSDEGTAAFDLRAQVAMLTEHMTKTMQEKDSVVGRFASWEEERRKLFAILKEKDEMISMLNASFQSMLKKP